MRVLLVILFLFACFKAHSATIVAASMNRSDVVTAIGISANGDTVQLPAGTGTWTTTVTNSKAIYIKGSGINSSIIVDEISAASVGAGTSSQNIIQWNCATPTLAYELSDITITNGSMSGRGFSLGCLQVYGLTKLLKLHDIDFRNIDNENIYLQDCMGVGYNLTWQMDAGGYRCIIYKHPNIFGGQYGDGSWETAMDWGGTNTFVIEDFLAFKNTGVVFGFCDGFSGGRLVLRHGGMKNLRITDHGTESTLRERGGRSFEIYKVNITNTMATENSGILVRSGGLIAYSNNFYGGYTYSMKGESYRRQAAFAPWGTADGVHNWDTALGAVFDSGTATSGGPGELNDTTKTWTASQYVNYQLRQKKVYTGTSGGVRTVTVLGAGWQPNQWIDWDITKDSDNTKGHVASNTSDTLTMASDYYAVDLTGGGNFTLSLSSIIIANTATKLTMAPNIEGTDHVFTNFLYEIRNLDKVLDDPGLGQTDPITGNITAPNHQILNQQLDPIYTWECYDDGVATGFDSPWPNIQLNRNYFNSTPKPGYTALAYPYPGRGAGPTPPGNTGAQAAFGLQLLNQLGE